MNAPGKKMRSLIARTTSGFQKSRTILSGNPVSAGLKMFIFLLQSLKTAKDCEFFCFFFPQITVPRLAYLQWPILSFSQKIVVIGSNEGFFMDYFVKY